jgi:hypothetical protein
MQQLMTQAQDETLAYLRAQLGYTIHKWRLTRNLSVIKVIVEVRAKLCPHNVRLVIEPDGTYHRPMPAGPKNVRRADWHAAA